MSCTNISSVSWMLKLNWPEKHKGCLFFKEKIKRKVLMFNCTVGNNGGLTIVNKHGGVVSS